jgi:hypothetical protein
MASVPGGYQTLGILKHLSIGRAPGRGFLLRGVAALILHLAAVEAHDRTVLLSGTVRKPPRFPIGQHVRDKIAPETFKKLVLIAVIAAGADLLRHGSFS